MYVISNKYTTYYLATSKEIKHIHEHSPAHMRLGLRDSPLGKVFLIGDIQVSVTSYILQISPVVSNHSDVFEIRITDFPESLCNVYHFSIQQLLVDMNPMLADRFVLLSNL